MATPFPARCDERDAPVSSLSHEAPDLDRVLRLGVAVLLVVVLMLGVAEAVARKAHPLFHLVRTPHYEQMKLSIEEPAYWFPFAANALGKLLQRATR